MIKTRYDNKSRRLRKKLYLGEFAEAGFNLDCTLTIKEDKDDKFLDSFLAMLEHKRLAFVGGVSPGRLNGFVCGEARYQSPSEEQRSEVEQWLTGHPLVQKVCVGDFLDAWHGDY